MAFICIYGMLYPHGQNQLLKIPVIFEQSDRKLRTDEANISIVILSPRL